MEITCKYILTNIYIWSTYAYLHVHNSIWVWSTILSSDLFALSMIWTSHLSIITTSLIWKFLCSNNNVIAVTLLNKWGLVLKSTIVHTKCIGKNVFQCTHVDFFKPWRITFHLQKVSKTCLKPFFGSSSLNLLNTKNKFYK